jgi:hypothetical protein
MVVVLLQTLLGILRTELTHFKKAEEGGAGGNHNSNETKTLSALIRKVKGAVSEVESPKNEAAVNTQSAG